MTQSKNYLVVQHNNLIESQYKSTLQEKRLILWLMAQIKPDDVDFKKYTLKISDFAKMVGLENNHAIYQELARITESLVSKVIRIEVPEEKKMIQVSFFSSATYKYGEGSVELSFDPSLKPFLLELNKQFTALSLSTVMNFSSAYAIRIYELLKQYLNIGSRTLKIQELKQYLGIGKDKYKVYSALKNRVIKPSFTEINEKSDINIQLHEIKEGRKVVSLKFDISKKPGFKQEKLYVPSPHEVLEPISVNNVVKHELMTVWGMSDEVAEDIYHKYDEDYIREKIQFIKNEIENKDIQNPTGYLRKALDNNWKKKNSTEILKAQSEFSIEEFINGIEDSVWKDVVERITASVGEETVLSWFPKLRFLTIRNTRILLSTNTNFTKNYVLERYSKDIIKATNSVCDEEISSLDIVIEKR